MQNALNAMPLGDIECGAVYFMLQLTKASAVDSPG
jgi:hypothetical protein